MGTGSDKGLSLPVLMGTGSDKGLSLPVRNREPAVIRIITAGSKSGSDSPDYHYRLFTARSKSGSDVDLDPAVMRFSVVVSNATRVVKPQGEFEPSS